MLERIYHIRPAHPSQEGPRTLPFTMTVRNQFVRGAPSSLLEICSCLSLESDVSYSGNCSHQTGIPKCSGDYGIPGWQGPQVALNYEKLDGCAHCNTAELKQ